MKTNIEWKKWGEIDPLFGVASWKGKGKDGSTPWRDDEFYALGKSDWANFKKHWDQYGCKSGFCLEIGCGAGRITKALAVDFDIVKAVDVSEAMINYAKGHIPGSNVEFFLSDGIKLPTHDDSVDAVFSTHVFQHFDSLQDAFKYFNEIFRVLKLNGTFMIHLPIYRWPGQKRIYQTLNNLMKTIGNVRARWLRYLIKRGSWHPLMRGLPYELDWLYHTLDRIGFTDVEFRIIRPSSNNDPHPFVLARKVNLQS